MLVYRIVLVIIRRNRKIDNHQVKRKNRNVHIQTSRLCVVSYRHPTIAKGISRRRLPKKDPHPRPRPIIYKSPPLHAEDNVGASSQSASQPPSSLTSTVHIAASAWLRAQYSVIRRCRSISLYGFVINPFIPTLAALSRAPSVTSAVTASTVGP